ncbi:MAG: GPP34 family phosphoprotein [Armatimonadetes bacterium]|nr:GPP34 family phosphoprotein [Armatimonadota bacterium]
MLTLAEQTCLLDAPAGEKPKWFALEFTYWGAVEAAFLGDLLVSGRLAVADGKAHVADPSPLGDDLLDELLYNLARTSVRWGLHSWIVNLRTVLPQYLDRLRDRMVAGDLLYRETQQWLGITWGTLYWVRDSAARAALEDELRPILRGERAADTRTAVLLAVAYDTRGVRGLTGAAWGVWGRSPTVVSQEPLAEALWKARTSAAKARSG